MPNPLLPAAAQPPLSFSSCVAGTLRSDPDLHLPLTANSSFWGFLVPHLERERHRLTGACGIEERMTTRCGVFVATQEQLCAWLWAIPNEGVLLERCSRACVLAILPGGYYYFHFIYEGKG